MSEPKERLKIVVAFLLGEGPLQGVWFGEKPAGARGNYWWRTHLREAAESNSTRRVSCFVCGKRFTKATRDIRWEHVVCSKACAGKIGAWKKHHGVIP